MAEAKKARAMGMNHVALEVGDIDAALDFYGRLFEFDLRGRSDRAAFVDLGDQFINFATPRGQQPDGARHLGLVVDDKDLARRTLDAEGVELLPGDGVDFLDPWGNHIQLVDYRNVQYSKTPGVLRGMGLDGLEKWPNALEQLQKKNMADG